MTSVKINFDPNNCFLIKNSPPAWHELINSNKKIRRFKKGETLFEEGNTIGGMYFLYEGIVKVHRHWGSQKELIIRFAKPGDMIGYRGLGNDRLYTVTATAVENVTVGYVDIAFFESLLQTNNQLTYQIMQFYAGELQRAEKKMSNLVHMSVKTRVAESLLALLNQFGKNKEGYIDLQLSRQDIAAFVGTTYETLFRTFQELIQEKLVKISGKKIFLLKEKKLEAMIVSG